MRFLFLQFEAEDAPGLLGTGLNAIGACYDTVHLYQCEPLPVLDGYHGLIVLGGSMNALDDEHFPYLPAVVAMLREAHRRALPTLGVCLGGQLLARALGARVYRKPRTEIGYYPIELTVAGQTDPLFRDLPTPLITFQWHEDAFELPTGAILLADSPRDTPQAFRSGASYGIQFHPEVTPDVPYRWAINGPDALLQAADPTTSEQLRQDGEKVEMSFAAWTALLCRNLAGIVEAAAPGNAAW